MPAERRKKRTAHFLLFESKDSNQELAQDATNDAVNFVNISFLPILMLREEVGGN
jgi:hypothetical protein